MEVFSRRSPVSLPVRSSGKDVPVMAPEQVQLLFRRRLSEICARFEDWQVPVTVSGVIGEVPVDRWRRREGTPLLDQKTGTSILLDMSPSLLEGEGLHAGEQVRVLGLLRAILHQGQVTPRFEVFSIVKDEDEAVAGQREALMQVLRDVPPQRRDFPVREGARMLLLGVGMGLERLHGLRQALGGFWTERNVTVRSLPEGMSDVAVQSLREMEQDVVFLVVAENRMAELETPAFMKGLLQCPAYRVLACDMAVEGEIPAAEDEALTVLPHLVERFFHSSVEAAGFLRQQSNVVRQHQDEERAHQEELAALRASLTALAERPADAGHGFPFIPLLVGLVLGGSMALAGAWMFHLF